MIDLHKFFKAIKQTLKDSKSPGHFLGVTISGDKVHFLCIVPPRKLTISLWRKLSDVWGGTTFHLFYLSAEQAFKDKNIHGILKGVTLERSRIYFISVVDSKLAKTIWEGASVEWEKVCQSLEEEDRCSCFSE